MGHFVLDLWNKAHLTDAMMKYVLLLALVALAAAQLHGGHRPGFNHGDPLHHLVRNEVLQIIQDNPGITAEHCADKCDALFEVNAGHDEENTDMICKLECNYALHHPRPTH